MRRKPKQTMLWIVSDRVNGHIGDYDDDWVPRAAFTDESQAVAYAAECSAGGNESRVEHFTIPLFVPAIVEGP